jgi:uncharacterized membrane protein
MTDALTLFAGLVVAPAGVVLAVLVTFILVRDVRRDWRSEFQPPAPRKLSVHEQAAADLAQDALDAAEFARELATLAECDVALPEDRNMLRSGALLALMDSRAMLADADALLKEHQS